MGLRSEHISHVITRCNYVKDRIAYDNLFKAVSMQDKQLKGHSSWPASNSFSFVFVFNCSHCYDSNVAHSWCVNWTLFSCVKCLGGTLTHILVYLSTFTSKTYSTSHSVCVSFCALKNVFLLLVPLQYFFLQQVLLCRNLS